MNLSKLSISQLVNLSLAVFLLLGIAATTYTVNNLVGFDAEAAKGGVPASITLDQTEPHLGDFVTFTTTGTGQNVALACYQGTLEVVWTVNQRVGTSFLLGGTSSIWKDRGGSADCYAYLIGKDMRKVYASTRFTALGAR